MWYLNDKIINKDDKKYIKTIYNIETPLFIFIGFEFSESNDLYNVNNIDSLNLISFNK